MIDPYDAIGLGNARDKAEALATPVPGAVSDAMVERALKGWSDSHPEVHGNTKKALRAALEAAVQSPPTALSDARDAAFDDSTFLRSSLAEAVATEPVAGPVWVQNLISHIDGTVTFPDEWKAIFIKQLRSLSAPTGDSGALREALVQTRNHLDLIITDGIPMDWQAWRDDIEAALSKGEPGK